MVRPLNLLMMFAFLGLSSAADAAPDALDVCSKEPDPAARLACFDQEMARRHRSAASAPEQHAGGPVAATSNQKRAEPKDPAIHAPPAEPVVATITKLVPRSGHLYYFELDNGQVWGQTEAIGDLWVGAHESVTITPGAMGGFFLATQGHRAIRVYRVR